MTKNEALRNEIRPACKAIAERMVRAENDFLESLVRCGGIDKSDAVKVLAFYRKLKVVKSTIDRVSVKHGAFLDRDTITRALAEANA